MGDVLPTKRIRVKDHSDNDNRARAASRHTPNASWSVRVERPVAQGHYAFAQSPYNGSIYKECELCQVNRPAAVFYNLLILNRLLADAI